MEIPQEKAEEFQQVAALLASDIDLAWDMAQEEPENTKFLFWIIKNLKEKRDIAISDAQARQKRFEACCLLFSLPLAKEEEDHEHD